MTFHATVLTLYPEMFPGPLGVSLAGRAMAEGKWAIDTVQIRDFAADKHRTVDDTPAGGGAGMVLRVDVLAKAIDHARQFLPGTGRGTTEGGGGAPSGEERCFTQRRRGSRERQRRRGKGGESPGRRPPTALQNQNQKRLRRNHSPSASLFFLRVSA